MASRILVIDDSTTLRKLVEVAMRGTGCEIDFAATGGDGVARARALRPDVVLLDYLLPDLRSAEVCARLRDDPATAAVPVVIMSAKQRSVLDELRGFATVVGYIGKPFTPAEIRARLEQVLREAPAPAEHAAAATPASSIAGGLELRGELAVTPLLEVLRLLGTVQATGTLVVEHVAVARIALRRGEIVMALATPAPGAQVVDPASQTPLELRAASTRLLASLLDVPAGRFRWEPAAALPDFVEAFGRHVSLTAIVLERGRHAAVHPDGALDRIYDRTPRFSHKLAGARLDAEEQRVLAALDGRCRGRELADRCKLPHDRVAAILTRLCAADLIRDGQGSQRGTARTLATLDLDPHGFVAPLRARLGRRAHPIDVIELDPTHALATATLAARVDLVLVSVAALTRHALDHELPLLARDGGVAVVCVLDAPNATLADQLLRAGLHAVIAMPVHLNELEHLFVV